MLEHHPACSCQFPGNGPDGDNAIRFGLLSFIEPLRQGFKAYIKMRRFGESPGEILVASFGIAFAFLFAALPQIEWVDYRMVDERQRLIRADSGYQEPLAGVQC